MALSRIISVNPGAKVFVIIGGSPMRMEEVLKLLTGLGDFTVYGTFSEREAMSQIYSLRKVDLVIIGSKYTTAARNRICGYVLLYMPDTMISQPGLDYPNTDEGIIKDIKQKLNIDQI